MVGASVVVKLVFGVVVVVFTTGASVEVTFVSFLNMGTSITRSAPVVVMQLISKTSLGNSLSNFAHTLSSSDWITAHCFRI